VPLSFAHRIGATPVDLAFAFTCSLHGSVVVPVVPPIGPRPARRAVRRRRRGGGLGPCRARHSSAAAGKVTAVSHPHHLERTLNAYCGYGGLTSGRRG
jgi:hypothetical protein